jgi:hypothetical protein
MGGIGTRRWVKFAKYLNKLDYKVHILTAEYNYEDKTNWLHDINGNINIYYFKSKYPLWLLSESSNRIVKQFKRYSNFILNKLFFYLDIAQYDSKNIITKAKEIIAENKVLNVVATGHPVSINYISTYLKIDNPNINLIQDFRDNWNDLSNYHYPNGLKFFWQKESSVYKEFITTYYSDAIINVSDDLTNMMKNKYKAISDKFITITNGYDVDDFKDECKNENNNFNIIYTGSLYNKRIEAVNLILDAIIELNDEFINENLKIILYTNFDIKKLDIKYSNLVNKNIYFKSFVNPIEINSLISNFRYCLSINSSFASYAFGTKIFDYMALNKKILHISNGGSLYKLLESRNQFVSNYNLIRMKEILLNIKNDYLDEHKEKKISDFSEFSLDKLTLKLEKYFI